MRLIYMWYLAISSFGLTSTRPSVSAFCVNWWGHWWARSIAAMAIKRTTGVCYCNNWLNFHFQKIGTPVLHYYSTVCRICRKLQPLTLLPLFFWLEVISPVSLMTLYQLRNLILCICGWSWQSTDILRFCSLSANMPFHFCRPKHDVRKRESSVLWQL